MSEPDRAKLDELLERVRQLPPMSPEQRREQRRSWVRGELMLEHPKMTREQADALIDKAEAVHD